MSILLERLRLRLASPAIKVAYDGALGVGRIEEGLVLLDSHEVLLVAREEGALPLRVLAKLPLEELGTLGGVGIDWTEVGRSNGGGPPWLGGRSPDDPGWPDLPLSTAALAA